MIVTLLVVVTEHRSFCLRARWPYYIRAISEVIRSPRAEDDMIT